MVTRASAADIHIGVYLTEHVCASSRYAAGRSSDAGREQILPSTRDGRLGYNLAYVGINKNVEPTVTDETAEVRNRELLDLLHGCALGRQSDFARLYELVSPQLFAVLMRILKRRDLAEDALQDAFASVWRNAASYTAERGAPMTWLVSIARYRALDMLRQRRQEVPLDAEVGGERVEEALLGDAEDSDELSHAEARVLKRCLDRLQQAQRNSLSFAYFQGLTHDEIAVRLQAPIGTVKSWVRRGLQNLKRCLEAA